MITNTKEIIEAAAAHAVEVIGQYVELKSAGHLHKGCCPFHAEKMASFTVYPNTGRWHCFGCGMSGDLAEFLKEHAGMTFPEALQAMANTSGMVVNFEKGNGSQFIEQTRELKKEQDRLGIILQAVLEHYRKSDFPFTEKEGIVDMDGRSYPKKILERFQVCWGGDNEIKKAMKASEWSSEDLQKVGVLIAGEKGTFDRFRLRILFPIFNHLNQVIGFGGRKRANDRSKRAKYINTPESPLYNKSSVLYGIYQARKAIRKAGYVSLVEGYTDVLTMHQYGFENTVASCGTAFTIGQAKLIKRFTDRVIVIRDGDDAGLKATENDVDTSLKAGLKVSVCIIKEGEDPDSILREAGSSAMQAIIDNAMDGLIWRVMEVYDADDPYKREEAIKLAASLLVHLDSEMLRDQYIKDLSKSKYLGSVSKDLKTSLSEALDKAREQKSILSPAQQQQVVKYGIYEHKNRYYAGSNVKEHHGICLSNFILDPIMLVKGSQKAFRFVEIRNVYGHRFIKDFDSNVFYDQNSFGKEVESWGNYLFTANCKKEHYQKLKAMIYEAMPTCFPITTMGQHREGFYSWANGISFDGKFIPANENGIVEWDETKYFLRYCSKINTEIKSDDQDEFDPNKKLFRYFEGETMSFRKWSELMITVHLENAMMGISWAVASIFRDVFYEKFSFFPHRVLFGPTSAGKSFMARSVVSMFGKPIQGFNLLQGTEVGLWLRLEGYRNAVSWLDEYSNDVDTRRIEVIKASYDGGGHEKANKDNFNQVSVRKAKSGILISGQQQPTKDIAMFKRIISLNFPGRARTSSQLKAADRLVDEQSSGRLSQITAEVVQHRHLIEEKLDVVYDNLRAQFKKEFRGRDRLVEDRMLANYLIPLCCRIILRDVLDWGFEVQEFSDFVFEQILEHSESLTDQDEVAIWWRIIQFLIESFDLREKVDFIVQIRTEETLYDSEHKKDCIHDLFETPRKLLYLRFSKAHTLYQERHKKSRDRAGLDLKAVQYYLENSPAYVGQKKAKKFGERTYRCYVFNMEHLPLELEITE